jgi:PA14 domain-containing protein/chitobiase/beta-hexosaminidase-like protein/Big-like domain-containing protein/carboxypeptidase family protein
MRWSRRATAIVAFLLALVPSAARAQAPLRKIGEMELALVGLHATVDPLNPTVPKNTASGVRVVVMAGDRELSAAEVAAFFKGSFQVQALLSGPGLPTAVDLPHLRDGESLPVDPLLLPLPPLPQGGEYQLTNIRIFGNGTTLDVEPQTVIVKAIDQILVTSVKTRALTLDEIKAKGIVLDSDAYLGFEFTLGLKLESNPVNISFPVVFDRQGVPVPQPIQPPPAPDRTGIPLPALPTIVPMLLEFEVADGGGGTEKVPLTLPNGTPIRIPSVLVIPGNVGYLKQFFSAQLFVANGAPVGTNLVVRDVKGTIHLPFGKDTIEGPDPNTGINDDPLALPKLSRDGEEVPQPPTMNILGVGPDGIPGTEDDVAAFNPGEQGQAEFLVRGEKEGFHTLDFDIAAVLDGLPVGPVKITGKASGGVLVRNPSFNMTFTVPSVARAGEDFTLFVTISNVGQGAANELTVKLDNPAISGIVPAVIDKNTNPPTLEAGERTIPTLAPGDSKTLSFKFKSNIMGKVVASYLALDLTDGGTGSGTLRFSLGVGERGVPLSPDTLVLPSAVDLLPSTVVEAAMRVLGQAWSLANAPAATLPRGVLRTDRNAVTQKALALAEAGLRMDLGEPEADAIRDLAFEFYGGGTLDPGFDQLLRQTEAGDELARALGNALKTAADDAGGPLAYEGLTGESGSPAGDFVSFGVTGQVGVSLTDAAGRKTIAGVQGGAIPSAVFLSLGTAADAGRLGIVTSPVASPYVLELGATSAATAGVSATFPRGDGTFAHVDVPAESLAAGGRARLTVDLANPASVVVELDPEGDGTFTSETRPTTAITPPGPHAISANIIGPETFDAASPFGLQGVVLFDRPVDAAEAGVATNYVIPANKVLAARAQLSGRIVFLSLARPEGPYIPTTLTVSGMSDRQGRPGATETASIYARLQDPGAVVTGRVLNADGTPVSTGFMTYMNQIDWTCNNPIQGALAAIPLAGDGRYEIRYVRQDNCGAPFQLLTVDPLSGSLRTLTSYVRAAGEQIVLDVVLFGRGTVTGIVRQNGTPVPGAKVAAFSGTDPRVGGNATTDAEGRYTINGMTVGTVTVRAAKGLSVGQAAGRVERAGNTAIIDVNLESETVRISGKVTKLENGKSTALPGVYVYYYLAGYGAPMGFAQTDAAGMYVLAGLPAGAYTVQAALNQRDTASVSGISTPQADIVHNLIIAIAPPEGFGTVTGVVKLPGGQPAGGVVVAVGDRGVLSDETTGAFTIPGVAVQPNQTVSARTRDGLRSGSTTFSIFQPGQQVTTSITLSGLGSIVFTVLDPANQPIQGIFVRRLEACADPCGCAIGSTDAQGRVRFDNVGLGGMAVQAIRTGAGAVDVASALASVTRDGEESFAVLRFNGSGTVVGKVLNPDDTPSFGADVALTSTYFFNDGAVTCGLTQGVSHRARTDQSGEFRFTGVNVGAVSVTASQPFFPTQVGQSGTLGANGQEVRFDLKLVNTISGELKGTVYLPDGVTPAGAGVDVSATGPLPEVVVKTNDQGFYRFPKIFPEGTYSITTRDGVTGGVAREQIYLRAGQDSVHDQRLKGTGTVRVRVVNALDEPVTTAFVRLRETDFPNGAYERAIEASNEGVATFESVFEGPFNVEVSDPLGRGGRFSSVLPHAGDTVEVKVRMTVTGTVQGRFLMPDGITPIPFGSVTLIAGGRVVGQATTRGTDPVGSFSFAYVPAGDLRVEAQDPLTARAGVAVGRLENEGDVVPLDVTAQGLGTVEGTVFSNGTGQDQAHVEIVSGSYRAGTTTDASGHYLVRGVPEGGVFVNASLTNGFLSGSASGALSGDADSVTIDVNLRNSGGLTGHVLNPDESVAPLSIVTVQVGGAGGGTFSTTTDEQGQFAFSRLPAGTASLTANAIGSIDQGAITTDVPSASTRDVTLHLNGTGSIQGHTLDSAGNPIAGNLWLQGTGRFGWGVFLRVGNDGFFIVPDVLAGPYTASLTAQPGDLTLYGAASGDIAPGEQEQVDVQVQDSGTVTGIVLRSDGATPAAGAHVTVRLEPFRGAVTLQAQSDGRFTARGVPLGAFSVFVSDPVTTGVALVPNQNLAGNGNTADVGSIVLDDRPVSVLAVDPPDGSTGIPVGRTVVFTLSDPIQSPNGYVSARTASGQGVSWGLSLSADGRTLTFNPLYTWPDSQDVILTLTTGVTDIFGRHLAQNHETRFHTVDLSPPAVASIVPANGAIQVGPSATVVVTFNEDLAPAQDVSGLVVLGGPLGTVSGTVTRTASNVVTFTPASALTIDSSYGVIVNGATDVSGNTQTAPFGSAFKTLDTMPPVLSLAAPPSGAWIKVKRPEIFLYLSDSLSGVDPNTKGLSLDDVTVTPGGGSNTLQFTPATDLSDGLHHFAATVNDRAGNPGATSDSFGVDTELPGAASVTGVVDGQVISGTITIGGSATDAPSGVQKIEVFADGGLIANAFEPSFTAACNTNALSEGPHAFTARATDRAGNVGPIGSAVTVTVDNKQITVVITKPDAVNPLFASSVFVKAVASEPIQSMDFTVSVGGTPYVTVTDPSDPYEMTLNLSAVPEGGARITATAHGQDTQSAFKDIVVDRTPPSAPDASKMTAEQSDAGFAQVAGLAGAVEGSSMVEVTNIATAAMATTVAAQDGTFSLRLLALLDAELSVVAVDAAGNRSVATIVTVGRAPSRGGVPLAGLSLWVSADVGVTTDASGNVSHWTDQSDAHNDVSQPTEPSRPKLIADGFNGWPVLRFDGSDVVNFTTRLTTVRTVFWVVKEDASATSGYRPLLGDSSTADFAAGYGAPGTIWRSDCCWSDAVVGGQTFLNGAPIDGRSVARPRTMSVISLVTTANVRASNFAQAAGYGSWPWWGDLAELIIYDRPLSSGDRQAVEDYLVRKYRPYTPTAGAPAIVPAGGLFEGSTTVTLSSTTPDASIYYTLDGSEPTASSLLYAGAFVVTETTTVKAKAVRAGFLDSSTATATLARRDEAPPTSGMLLWLRADAGLPTNGGGWVTSWGDQSGNGNDATQWAGAALPHVIPGELNGLPVVRFDGGDVVNFTTRLTTIRTVFWVVKEDVAATNGYRPLLGDSSTADFAAGYGAPGTIWRSDCCWNDAVVGGQTWINGTPVDGRSVARPRTMSVMSLVTTANVRASNFAQAAGYGSWPWWGDLAELIIYDRPLSGTERKAVEDYLLVKYQLGGTVTAPTVSPAGGLFADRVTVTLSTPTPRAEIFYTVDGTEPTTSSTPYAGPFEVGETTTLKVKAFRGDLPESTTVTAGFTRSTDFNPTSTAGLQLWLRADAGVPSYYGDLWLDQSGHDNHASQTLGTAIPRLVPNGVNGLPVMRFDGSDVVNFTTRLTTIRTVFWVVKEDAAATNGYRPLLGDSSTADFAAGYGAPGTIWRSDCCWNDAVVSGQTWINGTPVDGRSVARPRTMSVMSLVTTANVRASNFAQAAGYGSWPWWGDLAELIIYDRPLAARERRSVEEYLLSKYGIGAVSAPVATPSGGSFSGSVAVGLSSVTRGAEIFYTTDGRDPTTASARYTEPIVVTTTATLKAKAFREDLAASATTTATFISDGDFTPLKVPNVQLWWRADAGVPSGFGDSWIDQSGNGNDGFQPNGSAVPRLVPNAVNGLPAMRFDGGDVVNFTTRLTTVRTVFWVVKEDAAATAGYRPLLGDSSTADFAAGYGAPGTIWRNDCCWNDAVVGGQTRVNGTPVDGRSVARPRTMSVISLVTTADVRASNFAQAAGYGSWPWWGDLAELVIYDRPLSTDERKQVEDYLRIRYWDLSVVPGNHQVTLSWTTRPGAGTSPVTYDVERSTTSGSGYVVVASGLSGTTLTNTGLDDQTTYYYRVVAVDQGNRFASREVVGTPLRVGTGTGLLGEYFNNPSLSAPVVISRTDPVVDFNWGGGSPDASIGADNFSVRWTGQVQATTTGDFVFATNSDDGVRLWVEGQQVIDNWTDHGDTLNSSAPVHLEAGEKYDLRLEWYERGSAALVRLSWSYPGQALQVIPQSQLYPVGP